MLWMIMQFIKLHDFYVFTVFNIYIYNCSYNLQLHYLIIHTTHNKPLKFRGPFW